MRENKIKQVSLILVCLLLQINEGTAQSSIEQNNDSGFEGLWAPDDFLNEKERSGSVDQWDKIDPPTKENNEAPIYRSPPKNIIKCCYGDVVLACCPSYNRFPDRSQKKSAPITFAQFLQSPLNVFASQPVRYFSSLSSPATAVTLNSLQKKRCIIPHLLNKPLSITLLRNNYLKSEKFEKCELASTLINSLSKNIVIKETCSLVSRECKNFTQTLSTVIPPTTLENVKEKFTKHCLMNFSSKNYSRFLNFEQFEWINRNVGTLYIKYFDPDTLMDIKERYACHAVKIGSYFYSAKHCFYKLHRTKFLQKRVLTRIAFSALGNLNKNSDNKNYAKLVDLKLDPGALADDEYVPKEDFIRLSLKDKVQKVHFSNYKIFVSESQLWEQLIIPAKHRFFQFEQKDNLEKSQKLQPNYHLDLTPFCSVMLRDDGLIFHHCETINGSSGAPILTLREGRLHLLGLHTGDSRQLTGRCRRQYASYGFNFGIEMPTSLRDQTKK